MSSNSDLMVDAAAVRKAGLVEELYEYVTVEHVKAKKGRSRPALCVSQPRSEDADAKKKPLAAMGEKKRQRLFAACFRPQQVGEEPWKVCKCDGWDEKFLGQYRQRDGSGQSDISQEQ